MLRVNPQLKKMINDSPIYQTVEGLPSTIFLVMDADGSTPRSAHSNRESAEWAAKLFCGDVVPFRLDEPMPFPPGKLAWRASVKEGEEFYVQRVSAEFVEPGVKEETNFSYSKSTGKIEESKTGRFIFQVWAENEEEAERLIKEKLAR